MFEWIRRWLRPATLPLLPPPSPPPGDPMEVYYSRPAGGIYKRGRFQRRWFDTVQVGDVLVSPSGKHRVVRGVKRYSNGDLRCLTFAIKRCTWTNRGHTYYGFTDLRLGGWRPTGVRVELGSELDFHFEVDLATICGADTRLIDCCIAKDMP